MGILYFCYAKKSGAWEIERIFRYKMVIEYDGTPFFGWQRQADGRRSVQQLIEESMQPLLKSIVSLHCAGRTDAGVHALGQVAHFDFDCEIDCFKLLECTNSHLRKTPICILSIERVPSTFHARISAVRRYYMYKILNRRGNPALYANRAWLVPVKLNIEAMNRAAQYLVGYHDFSSFRAAGCQQRSPIKTVDYVSVRNIPDEGESVIVIKIAAKSFLYHQVRNIVGSLELVGREKWDEDRFRKVLEAKDRSVAGPTAPACGLYFEKVAY